MKMLPQISLKKWSRANTRNEERAKAISAKSHVKRGRKQDKAAISAEIEPPWPEGKDCQLPLMEKG
jgi:hypothetical protein